MKFPKENSLWTHFKRGDIYRVRFVAQMEGSGEPYVIYQHSTTYDVTKLRWIRSVKSWYEVVIVEGSLHNPDQVLGKTVQRFTPCSDDCETDA